MDLKPCRDCGTPVQTASRSCPHCGIMNPVHKWVALPDGSDETFRVPVTAQSAMVAAARSAAVLNKPPKSTMERIFGRVDTAEEAREVIDWCSTIFYILAGIQVVAAFFFGAGGLAGAVVLAALATWLRMGKSRVAAGLLLALSVLSIVMTVLGGGSFGGLWLMAIAAGLAWRAFNAAVLLQKGH
ncbi:MAG TPA: hypothetical protein VFS20_19120 [Longimicrobium sp.]|nr:hypothetical protein [Longimicrobium sp.]